MVMAADTYDRISVLLAASGGVKLKKEDMYPRPQVEAKPRAMTVADFDVAHFERMLAQP
jgi:hypothetical protein